MDNSKYIRIEKCIYKKTNERKYLVDLFVGRNEIGKQIRKSKTCNSLKEARNILSDFKRDKRNQDIMYCSCNKTLNDLMNEYIENVSRVKNEDTTVFSQQNVKEHLFSYFGDQKLNNITSSILSKYFLYKQKEGLKSSTLKKHFSFLNSIFKYAIYMKADYGIIKNPMLNVLPVATKKKSEHLFLEPKEILEMKEVLEKESRDLLYPFMIAVFTGMRRGELCALRFDDIDFKNNTIRINRNRVCMGSIVVDKLTTKTHTARTIDISIHLKEMLISMLEDKNNRRRTDKEYNSNNFVLIDNKTGKELNPTLLTMRFNRFLNKHPELKKIKFHELRHTYITNAISLGQVSVSDVAKTVGNSKEVCLNVYSHASKNAVSKTVSSYDKIFEN